MDEKALDRTYYFTMLFHRLDKERKGYLRKEEVRDLMDEIHSLMEGKINHDTMDMKSEQFDQYWTTIDHNHDGKCYLQNVTEVITTYDIWRFEKIRKEEIEEIFDTKPHCMRSRVLGFMSTPNYELFSNLSTIVNVLMIYVGVLTRSSNKEMSNTPLTAWLTFEIVWNFLNGIELILDIYGNGSVHKAFRRKFRAAIEAFCQFLNIMGLIFIISKGISIDTYYHLCKPFEFIIFLRLLKLTPLLHEIRSTRLVITTMGFMLDPISTLAGVVFLIFYEFAVIGQFLFGGVIENASYKTPYDNGGSFFTLMNFNDVFSSLVTLFALMIVNNWYVMVNQTCAYMGNINYRLYFYAFYYVGVIIATNILVAFAIDIYSVVCRLDDSRHANKEIIVKMLEDHERMEAEKKAAEARDAKAARAAR